MMSRTPFHVSDPATHADNRTGETVGRRLGVREKGFDDQGEFRVQIQQPDMVGGVAEG